ncbi:hypothetical protein FRB96_009172, partial [Tulasnella sp. 330]
AHEEEATRLQASVSKLSESQAQGFLLHTKERSELRSTINDLERKVDSLESANRDALKRVEELELGEADEDMDGILLAIEATSFSVQRLTVRDLQEQLSAARTECDNLLLEKRWLVSELSKAEEKTKRIGEARERLATEYALLAMASRDWLKATGGEERPRESVETPATSSGGRLLKRVASRIPGVRGLRRCGDR